MMRSESQSRKSMLGTTDYTDWIETKSRDDLQNRPWRCPIDSI